MRAILCPLLFSCVAATAQLWEQMPDFPGSPRDDAASFQLDAAFCYVGTGRDTAFQYMNDWYVFDMMGHTWSEAPALPASGRQYCSAFTLAQASTAFLFGGTGANGPLNELWRFDYFSQTWTQAASLPGPGRYACTVITTSDQAYVCGGLLAGGTPTNEVWRYDHFTNAWTQMAPFPGTPRHRAAGMDLLVIGGADADYQAFSDVFEYNPTNDTWTQLPDLPQPRFGARAAEQVLIGGASSLTDFHADIFVQDWQNDTWSGSTQPFPGGPRRGAVASVRSPMADVCIVYFGTGLNGTMRYNDWWRMVCPFTSVSEVEGSSITVFPNPATDHVTLTLPANWHAAGFGIHDAVGRVISAGAIRSSEALNVRDLATGRYSLVVEHAGRSLRAPFIKLP